MINKKIFEKILLLFDTIVIIYALIVISRFATLTNLEKRGIEYSKKSNFKVEQEFSNEGYITKVYSMYYGNKCLSKDIMYNINSNNNQVVIDYINNGESYTLINTDLSKSYYYRAIDNNNNKFDYSLDGRNLQLSFQEKLIIAVLGNIHTDKYDFKDAYYISLNSIMDFGNEIIVDKETGLVVEQSQVQEKLNVNSTTGRYEKEKYKDIQKFKYEFDTVKDDDIQKPDLTGYEKKNYND